MKNTALRIFRKGSALLLCITLAGCATAIPKDILKLSPDSLEQRQLQTRRYVSKEEKSILLACAGVLQDLGYTLDESETRLGVVVASKDRTAVDAGQVAGATFLVVLAALGGAQSDALDRVDDKQKIRASIITRPSSDEGQVLVRVTFQRIVWNRRGDLSRLESINDPELYQGFFERLSKAVFLEAQSI